MSECNLKNLRAPREKEKTFGLLTIDPGHRARDQYLHRLLNSTFGGYTSDAIHAGHQKKCSCSLPVLSCEVSIPADQCGSNVSNVTGHIPQKDPE